MLATLEKHHPDQGFATKFVRDYSVASRTRLVEDLKQRVAQAREAQETLRTLVEGIQQDIAYGVRPLEGDTDPELDDLSQKLAKAEQETMRAESALAIAEYDREMSSSYSSPCRLLTIDRLPSLSVDGPDIWGLAHALGHQRTDLAWQPARRGG